MQSNYEMCFDQGQRFYYLLLVLQFGGHNRHFKVLYPRFKSFEFFHEASFPTFVSLEMHVAVFPM